MVRVRATRTCMQRLLMNNLGLTATTISQSQGFCRGINVLWWKSEVCSADWGRGFSFRLNSAHSSACNALSHGCSLGGIVGRRWGFQSDVQPRIYSQREFQLSQKIQTRLFASGRFGRGGTLIGGYWLFFTPLLLSLGDIWTVLSGVRNGKIRSISVCKSHQSFFKKTTGWHFFLPCKLHKCVFS